MATMATEPDGMGYSRCFIADDADLEIRELPAELNGKVAFIRVSNGSGLLKKDGSVVIAKRILPKDILKIRPM